jgi:hypothetical protein
LTPSESIAKIIAEQSAKACEAGLHDTEELLAHLALVVRLSMSRQIAPLFPNAVRGLLRESDMHIVLEMESTLAEFKAQLGLDPTKGGHGTSGSNLPN